MDKKRRYASVKIKEKKKRELPMIKIVDNKDGTVNFDVNKKLSYDEAIKILQGIIEQYSGKELSSVGYIDKEEIVRAQLRAIGEDVNREGLIDTPKRVVKMWGELFKGYDRDKCPCVTTFNNGKDGIVYDQMITDCGTFSSHCEHHMVPFFGNYYFAYIPHPDGKLLGLSKVARVVNYYAARLQIQERLTSQIIEHLWESLHSNFEFPPPIGMALMIEGEHLCKSMRGVKIKGKMRTTVIKGAFKNDINVKNEFLGWINSNKEK